MIQASTLAGEPRRAGEKGRHVIAEPGRAWAVVMIALAPRRRLIALWEGRDIGVASRLDAAALVPPHRLRGRGLIGRFRPARGPILVAWPILAARRPRP